MANSDVIKCRIPKKQRNQISKDLPELRHSKSAVNIKLNPNMTSDAQPLIE